MSTPQNSMPPQIRPLLVHYLHHPWSSWWTCTNIRKLVTSKRVTKTRLSWIFITWYTNGSLEKTKILTWVLGWAGHWTPQSCVFVTLAYAWSPPESLSEHFSLYANPCLASRKGPSHRTFPWENPRPGWASEWSSWWCLLHKHSTPVSVVLKYHNDKLTINMYRLREMMKNENLI